MREAAFSKRTVRWLVAVCAVSFVGALLLSVFGPEMERTISVGPDTYSNSAIGHRALVELLRELDIPVVTSKHGSGEKAGHDALLVLAEPLDCQPHSPRGKALRGMVETAQKVLLVLPKWRARMSRSNSEWSDEIRLRAKDDALDPLRALELAVDVRRVLVTAGRPPPDVESWEQFAPTFPLPVAQYITGDALRPLVETPEGILLGQLEVENTDVLILSDPDVLANAGLGLGDNAPLVVGAIERLRPSGAAVVVDETIHGHEREPSIWRELFSFPLVLLVLQGAVTLIVLLWAGAGRFGSPQRARPALEPGRQFLIANTADLLRYRGIVGTALARYLQGAVTDARRRLHAPTGMRGAELDTWLDRLGARRGTAERISDLRALAAQSTSAGSSVHVLSAANRIHRWRSEILNGPSSRTRPS